MKKIKPIHPDAIVGSILLPQWRCLRCGHEWNGLKEEPPKVCPQCSNVGWTTPPGLLRRGRPPGAKNRDRKPF